MAEYEAFPGIVCQYIRNCVKARRKAQSEREQTFEERDEATRQIGEAMISRQPTEPHEAEYGRAVMKLDVLKQRLKYLEGEIDKAVDSADEPNLPYKNAKVDMPDFKPRAKHVEKGEKKPKEGDVDGQVKMQPEAPVPTGELQHLDADPSALDLPGPLLAKVRKAKITNIMQLVKLYEDKSKNLRDELDLSNASVDVLETALEKYRGQHRKAQMQADKEGAAPKR